MSDVAEFQAKQLSENAEFVGRVARALVRDPSDAEDVAQETCLAALRGGPDRPEMLRSWLRVTARNIACKMYRSRRRRTSREVALPPPEPAETSEAIVSRLQMQHRVVDAMLELNEPYRTALYLRYFENLGPRQIALRQQVPLNTVRARLRRGLERMRAQLDAAHDGSRSAWCAALLPLTHLGSAPVAAGTAGVATGLAGLFSQAGFWAAALLLAGSLAGFAWLAGETAAGRDEASAEAGPQTAQARAVPGGVGPDADDAAGAGADPREDGPQRVAILDPNALDRPTPARAPGRVVFRPFDAITGDPAPSVSVRYLSADRFADGGQVDGAAEALLTAGVYRAALTAPGYEPKELEPFTIIAGRTIDLGYVAMNRGLGSIAGRVRAPSHPPGTEIMVELRGQGRHPCRKAEAEADLNHQADPELPGAVSLWSQPEPCPYCGFARDASRLELISGDPYEFTGLASGPYLLHAFIPGPHPVGVTRELTLSPAGRLFEDLLLSRTVQMTFDLRDSEGNPVTGLFETDDGTVGHAVRFLFLEGTRTRAEARAGGTFRVVLGGATASLLRITPRIDVRGTSSAWGFITEYNESIDQTFDVLGPVEAQPLDRPREDEDTLFAHPSPPHPEEQTLPARMQQPGSFIVEAVPAELIDVVVRCGPLISDRVTLDLRSYNGSVIFLQLHLTDEPPEEEEFEGELLIAQELLFLNSTLEFPDDRVGAVGVSRNLIKTSGGMQISDADEE